MNIHSIPACLRSLPLFCLLMAALACPNAARADVVQNFDTITDDASYGDLSDYGEWLSNNAMVATNNARGGSGRCLVMDDDTGGYLLYEGADGNGKDGGLGTVSVWYRHWDADGQAVAFQTEYSQNGGAWIAIGSEVSVSSTTYAQFSSDVNLAGDNIQVRFRSTASSERLCLDDVTLTDMSGPAEDPNLSAASSVSFGRIMPGTAATQVLALANTGPSNTLHLTSLSAVSGDTARFSVGSLPASLAPGATAGVSVVYNPGAVTGVSHSAVFHLNTDDPSTPAHPVTFSGQTVGAALTVSNIQYSGAGTTSPENGNQVRVIGIATYADPYGYAIADPAGGPWSGIYVSDINHRPEIGDRVLVEGWVNESDSMTILNTVSDYQTLGTGYSVPAATISGSQLATEAYEGVYARIEDVTVNNINVGGADEFWQVTDGASVRVGTRVPYRYIWNLNDTLEAVQGIVFVEGSTISIQPRSDWDLIGRPVYEYALRGLVITPDGPKTNWYVHVEDDLIRAVTNTAPAGVTVLDTGGIVFPGLIDAHNHPSWNSFPTLMFNDFPFGHRDEWAATDEYKTWKNVKLAAVKTNAAVNDYSSHTISKYAEALELMAGCIAIQGNYDDVEYAHPDIMLFNVEEFPGRVWADIFPWTSSSGERTALRAQIDGGAVNAAVIHLCEGVDEYARAQFDQWRDWGMLDESTTIIHGAALGPSEFAQMAAVNAKLVWSPMSNMKLYGGTADAKAAKEAGVVIGLSPDWTASGCFNILEELGYAWQLNQTLFDNAFTAREMAEMVYLNTARCTGLYPRYGQIVPGANAGLCVISGDPADPYMALINARPPDVLLTIIDGTPRYGDPAMMTALGAGGESVTVGGVTKRFNIAVNHPFLDYGSTTFAQLRTALQTAHSTLTTTAVLNEDELQFLDLHLLQGHGGDDVPPFRADRFVSSAPSTSVTYDQGSGLSLAFRYEDFWDNETYITDLVHTISIAPAAYPQFLLQTIATNHPNSPARETVPFTVGFQDMHTNYVFVFETADARGNVRTTVATNTFKLAFHTGGDTDRDGMPNEWEITYFGGFSNALASGHGDADWMNNLQEYIAGTLPTSAASFLTEFMDAPVFDDGDICEFASPVPTTPDRLYDVWWTTNLAAPQIWHPANLNVPGQAGGAAVTLRVTNQHPFAVYRTGVKLP
ncbi:MAG TPA: amidohydrolase family protein [Kiritimatiellia bacterium]|nr:amidohydrolase family protein [Kiritimatiellia bacterium]